MSGYLLKGIEEPCLSSGTQPEHKHLAIQFANEMLDRFTPVECNEIFALIQQRWSEQWRQDIQFAESKIEHLKKVLGHLLNTDKLD